MSKLLPSKRIILAVHRWLGASAALFLTVLAITGLLLNHSQSLGLDRIHVNLGLVRNLYGMADPSDIRTYRIHELDTVSFLEGRLYFNGMFLTQSGSIIGVHGSKDFSVILCSDSIVLITREGELIDVIGVASLPFDSISAGGRTNAGDAVVISPNGDWQADTNWIEFTRYEGAFEVPQLELIQLPEPMVNLLLSDYQGSGPVLSKVILDLHSGRLFGWGGRTAMDLTAVAILLLVTTGLSGWVRKSRAKRFNLRR